ncbi:hypothetical protein Y032_0381g354 [Ancylostoma ceylanicum]|nr:hypothetical protein Y032_0381g354 [Ancylostoma ceylanicum]
MLINAVLFIATIQPTNTHGTYAVRFRIVPCSAKNHCDLREARPGCVRMAMNRLSQKKVEVYLLFIHLLVDPRATQR